MTDGDSNDDVERARLNRLFGRVMLVQVISLVVLWLLQSSVGGN